MTDRERITYMRKALKEVAAHATGAYVRGVAQDALAADAALSDHGSDPSA